MKMTTVFLSIFLLAVSSITSAQTQVSGNVMGTWATSNSPYIVTGNLLVPEGDSLVIEPGVEVKFNGSFELRVQGLLRTEGAESDTVVFTRNHQDTTWYGIYFDNADDGCELRYTKIEYSRAYTDRRNGAGIYSINTNLLIRNCLIQHNYARSDGGGIFIRGRFSNGLKNQVIISSSKITNNTSRDLGGAIYCESAKLILSNSLISQNKGRADLYIFRSSFVFANNTVYDNTYEFSSSHPPSYLVSSDGSIINSILWEWGGFVNSNSDNVKIMYSAIEGGFEGEGNIDSNPLFVDPQNGEFSLQVSSPCINAGHPSALFNDIDGSGNDMGTSGGSGLLTDPLNVEFGPAGKGQNRREVVYIHNFRDTPVRITSVSISDEDNFSAESVAPFDIQSFSLDSIAISFHPVVFKTLKEQLILESPDLFGASSAQIDLHGEAGIFSGVVSGVWNFQDSPFILHGNVLVEGGKTLVVEPGVQLRFRKGSSLEVPKEAGLFAKGTKDSMITFTSDEPTPFPGDWNGIILKGTENRVEIKYCQIEYATTGITCRAFTSGCNSYDNYATIENCQIQFNSGHGILLTGSGSSSGCTIPRTGHCNPNIRFNWIHFQ